MRNAVLFFLTLIFVAQAKPRLILNSGIGGNISHLKAHLPDTIDLEKAELLPSASLGISLEARFNDYLGLQLGALTETRGSNLHGIVQRYWIGLFPDSVAQYNISNQYLQVPLQLKVLIPMLFPGSVYVQVGPELGFCLMGGNSLTMRSRLGEVITVDRHGTVEQFDIGVSGALGVNYEFNPSVTIGIQGGYYLGILDTYDDSVNPELDADVYTRSIRFGIVLSTALGGSN